jgi:Uncharacterized small protein (DUF2158)
MTVEKTGKRAYTEEESVWCEWFDEKNQPNNKVFAPELLVLAATPATPDLAERVATLERKMREMEMGMRMRHAAMS